MSTKDRRYEAVKSGAQAQGRKELLKHLDGERLGPKEMITAKCYECMGYFVDGRIDCKMPSCPLYPFMPYQEGGARKATRVLSEEQKKAGREQLKKLRISRGAAKVG